MITIFVGDVTDYLRHHAQQLDILSKLITNSNYINISPGTYYTSLGDFKNYKNFADTLDKANRIIYIPPAYWSDENKQGLSYMKMWTEQCLFYFFDKKEVIGTNFTDEVEDYSIIELKDTRKSTQRQLWIAGGSDSHGYGVNENERFGSLISNTLDLPVSFLTEKNTSIEWAADQILRSDIRQGDIIIWGTVPASRFTLYTNKSTIHASVSYYEKHPEFNKQINIEHLSSLNTIFYKPMICIDMVQNICNKIGVNLIIAGLAEMSEYTKHLLKFKNYIHLHGRHGTNDNDKYLDFGSDGDHPGPNTHRWYADQIISKIFALKFET